MAINPIFPERETREKKTPAEVQREKKELQEKEGHLKNYLERTEKLSPKEKRDFFAKSLECDRTGNYRKLRRADISASENEKDPLKKHILLSSLFLERDRSFTEKMVYTVNFAGIDLALRKIGLGDMLPKNVKAVRVTDDKGGVVSERAFLAINPENGRIGYYDEETYRTTETYKYIAVFNNYSFEILKTGADNDPEVQRHIFAEHREIYESRRETLPAPRRGAAGKAEKEPGAQEPAPEMKIATSKTRIEGKTYDAVGNDFWLTYVGNTPEKVNRFLTTIDPVTGRQITFLGRPLVTRDRQGRAIPIPINILILPYLKEAEARMREAGVDYNITEASCFNWREVRGKEGTGLMSKHSWGTAIDINPERNPLNSRKTDIPQKFVEIMESVGFKWGGKFARPDPMHFQLQINPYYSEGVLKHTESQKYAAAILKEKPKMMVAERPTEFAGKKAGTPERPKYKGAQPEVIRSKLEKYLSLIADASRKYGVPRNLIMAIIWNESNGAPLAYSRAGAGGLMQLMPGTARHHGLNNIYPPVEAKNRKGKTYLKLDPRDDRANPEKNIMAGTAMLASLIKRYNGDYEAAAAAYNSGPGRVDPLIKAYGSLDKAREMLPAETQAYIVRVPDTYRRLNEEEQAAA